MRQVFQIESAPLEAIKALLKAVQFASIKPSRPPNYYLGQAILKGEYIRSSGIGKFAARTRHLKASDV